MELINIGRLLTIPIEELKYHELQQLIEILKVAIEKIAEDLTKLQKEFATIFPSVKVGSDVARSKDEE